MNTEKIYGIGALIGAGVMCVLNVATNGAVPGGFKGGMIGGAIGYVITAGILAVVRKK